MDIAVNGVIHDTYHATAIALHLAEDDAEYEQALEEAAHLKNAPGMRQFFCQLLMVVETISAPRLLDRFLHVSYTKMQLFIFRIWAMTSNTNGAAMTSLTMTKC